MVTDTSSESRGAADSESFEKWLDQAAESKGVSRQELMNQMLSSYWILDELTGLIGETGARGAVDHRSPGPSESVSDANPEGGTEPDGETDDRSTQGNELDGGSAEESMREIQAALRELVENQSIDGEQRAEEIPLERAPIFDEGVVAVVSDLQRQIGRFDSELDDLEGRQDAQFDRLSNELQLALDRVGELERTQDQFATKGAVNALSEELQGLDAQIETLLETNDELEARVDREFDSIEELFRRLLDAIDELDSDLEATTESYRNELEPIRAQAASREQLKTIKTDALRREIRTANCESCDLKVDIALLETPECPNCDAHFTGIDDSGWNPFRAPTVETAPKDEL